MNSEKLKKSANSKEVAKQNERILQLRKMLDSIKEKDVYSNAIGSFSEDKLAIKKIFELTSGNKKPDVLLRLTVIDSMYSTQMNRRYYAIEGLAEKLVCFNNTQELFERFIRERDINIFDDKRSQTDVNLWSGKYGIDKAGNKKGVAISLISKYAYFETGFNFPIFDTIACEMYPRIWKYCGWKEKVPTLLVKKKEEQQMSGTETIIAFTNAIDEMINKLGGNISYDHLDRLLWFTGKIYRGNLSLLISRDNYEWCVKNWRNEMDKDKNFDITKIDLLNAPFFNNNPCLKTMFDLAKTLKMNS